ncbi:hypothetical protein LXL04_032508 [Taraxacum kok-saghyz]
MVDQQNPQQQQAPPPAALLPQQGALPIQNPPAPHPPLQPQQNPQQGAPLPQPQHNQQPPLPQQNPQAQLPPPQQNQHLPPPQNQQPPPQQNPQQGAPLPPPQQNQQPPPQPNPQQGAPPQQNQQPPLPQQNPQPIAPLPPPQQNQHLPPPQNPQPPPQPNPQQGAPLPPPQPNPQQGAPPQQNQQLPAPPPPPPTYDHPNGDLLRDDRKRDFIDICVPLYNALMIGDWEGAQQILNGRQYLLRSSITENFETPLHVAAASAQSNTKCIRFVQTLVNRMDPADLKLQNKNGNTALSLAAASGNVEIARIMVMRNRDDLPTIANAARMMPLYIAVMFKNLEMVNFLYGESQQLRGRGWTPTNRRWLFSKSIEAELFDFALQILEVCPEVAPDEDALAALARNPSAFNEIKPRFFRKIYNSSITLIYILL